MLVHERDENPIDIKLLLYYRPNHCRIGVFTDSMFSVIIGFDVKGHRATSLPNKFWDLLFLRDESKAEPHRPTAQKDFRRAPLLNIPFNMNVSTFSWFVKIRNSLS